MNQPPKGVNIYEAPMVIHWQRWTSDRDFGMPGCASVTVDQILRIRWETNQAPILDMADG